MKASDYISSLEEQKASVMEKMARATEAVQLAREKALLAVVHQHAREGFAAPAQEFVAQIRTIISADIELDKKVTGKPVRKCPEQKDG